MGLSVFYGEKPAPDVGRFPDYAWGVHDDLPRFEDPAPELPRSLQKLDAAYPAHVDRRPLVAAVVLAGIAVVAIGIGAALLAPAGLAVEAAAWELRR